MDRRARFFLAVAIVCGALAPATDPTLRWVPLALSGIDALLSVASYADSRSPVRAHRPGRPTHPEPGDQPNRPVM